MVSVARLPLLVWAAVLAIWKMTTRTKHRAVLACCACRCTYGAWL